MITKKLQRKIRRVKKQITSRRSRFIGVAVVCIVIAISYTIYMNNKRLSVDRASYKPLLQLIATAESKNNYNAYFGNAANSSLQLTEMSIDEVLQWQAEYVRSGSPSDAAGRYQIISPTLRSLVATLSLDTTQKFDSTLQDTLAIALLDRRGSTAYINNEISHQDFAASIAKEWAALPKVVGENPSSSYYDGDGLNKSLVSIKQVQQAIDSLRTGQ